MTRTPPFQKICLAVVLLVVGSMGMVSVPVAAQQDSWPSDTRYSNGTDGASQDRNSNWNWYGNGVLVQPVPLPQGKDTWQNRGFQGTRPTPPTYYRENRQTEQRDRYDPYAPPAGTGLNSDYYGGYGEKSRPWGELPDRAQQPEPDPYTQDYRYQEPPRQNRWRNPEESFGYPSGRRSWQDYIREDERGYPEEQRRPRYRNYEDPYRPTYEDRYRGERHDPGMERGFPWQDGTGYNYGETWRRPPPYMEGDYP